MRRIGSPGLVLAFFVVFPVHLRTMCPAVYWDDAGELALAGAVLGVSHPPGQPLHALMGRAACLLPLGSGGAFRTNLLSAFLGSVCVLLAYRVVRGLRLPGGQNRLAGLLSAASLAWGNTFWGQSLVTENSTLHLFFWIALWGLFSMRNSGKQGRETTRIYGLAALLFCMGLANHPVLLLVLPALLLLLPWKRLRTQLRPSRAARILALGLIGGASYWVLLPLLAARNPSINLGDPSRWHRFLWVMLVHQYKQTAPAGSLLHEPLRRLAASLYCVVSRELPPGLPFLAAVGLLGLGGRYKRMVLATFALLPFFLYLDLNPNFIRPYQLPLYFLLALWGGIGFSFLARLLQRARTGLPLACLFFLGPPILLIRNHAMLDRSRDWSATSLAQDAFRFAERPTLFLTGSGHVFHVLLHDCWMDGRNASTAVLSRNLLARSSRQRDRQRGLDSHMRQHWPWIRIPPLEKGSLEEVLRLNRERVNIYWEGLDFTELGLSDTYETLYPSGPFFRVVQRPWDKRNAHSRDKSFWASWWKREIDNLAMLDADDTGRGFYALLLNARGNYFYGTKGKGIQQAAKEYARAARVDPLNAQAFCNLGAIMAERGNERGAEAVLEKALALDPSQYQAAFSLARIFLDRGDIEAAHDVLRKASLQCPNKPFPLARLGLLEAEANLKAEAVEHLEAALREAPAGLRKRILSSPHCPSELFD